MIKYGLTGTNNFEDKLLHLQDKLLKKEACAPYACSAFYEKNKPG